MKNWERWLLPLGLLVVLLASDFFALYALGLAGIGVALLLKPVLPDLSKREWMATGILSALLLVHLFFFRPSGFEFSLLARISFFGILWFSWRGFTAQLRWGDFWWPLAAGVALFSAFGFYRLKTGSPVHGSAEELGAALVLWWALPRPKKVAAQAVQSVAGGLGLLFLLVSDLSVLAAAVAGLLVVLLREKKKEAVVPFAGALALAAACFFALKAPIPAFPSFREKWEIWRATSALIQANPLGVGVDRFVFTFPTFSRAPGTDSALLFSPRNELLRWAAEDGLPLTILFLLGFAYFLRLWWKKGAPEKAVFLPVAAFFFLEMLWAAPWRNPFPMALGAVVLGAMGAGVWKRRMLPAHAGARALLLVSWLFLLVCLGRVAVSRALEESGDVFRAQVACRAVSSNWRACLNYGSLLLAQGETTGARREVERVLEGEPWNFVAIRSLGSIALRQGDRLEACFLTWKYDDLFGGQSQLSAQYEKNCPQKWRDYFARKRPKQYYRR